MKEDAILNVTKALQKRLVAALNGPYSTPNVFVGPPDDTGSSGAHLVLFPYRIAPTSSLRNRERRVPSLKPPGVDVFRNSLPLDVFYLLTVGAMSGPSEEGLLLALGLAMQALQTDPDLTGADVRHDTVRVSLETLSTEEASRIWSLFPTANYRTSVAYIASPVWIDPSQPDSPGVPVVNDKLGAGTRFTETLA